MRIYIETSVVSFCFDRKPHNREKRAHALRLLQCCRDRIHDGFVSYVVLGEIERSKEPFRSDELQFIARMGLTECFANRVEVNRLVETYQRQKSLKFIPEDDLRHVAVFSLSDLDGLATYNLRHIANQLMLRVVRKVNHAEGIRREIDVAPPEAFLPPGP